ncbi:hypothetical protein SVAN01_07286 [Stagonosporopsis vannaccii]|nr:hypothetical protein SVAN01_07286 [Stagonosporopsis vannaccii]
MYPAITASPQTTPTSIPAMAPATEASWWFVGGSGGGVECEPSAVLPGAATLATPFVWLLGLPEAQLNYL